MCEYLESNEQCEVRLPNPDGSRNVKASMAINEAFQEAAQKSPHYKDSKLGVGCGNMRCCFVAGKYATFNDCPYYKPA